MSPRDEVLDLMKQYLGRVNLIAVPVPFLELTGDADSALLLSQLLYWTDRARDDHGWVFKARADWCDELRLNRYRLDTARRRLRDLGILEESHHLVGARRVLHLRIRLANLHAGLRALGSSGKVEDGGADRPLLHESRHDPAHTSETTPLKNPGDDGYPTVDAQPVAVLQTNWSRPPTSHFRTSESQPPAMSRVSSPKRGITTLRTVELEPFERSKVDHSGLETTPETTSEISSQTTAETTSGSLAKNANEIGKDRPREKKNAGDLEIDEEPKELTRELEREVTPRDYRELRELCHRQARESRATNVNGHTYEDRLFEILERQPGFPQERDYPHLAAVLEGLPRHRPYREFGKFDEYWRGTTLARPWLALRVWLQRASAGSPTGTRESIRPFIWHRAPNGICYIENIVEAGGGCSQCMKERRAHSLDRGDAPASCGASAPRQLRSLSRG